MSEMRRSRHLRAVSGRSELASKPTAPRGHPQALAAVPDPVAGFLCALLLLSALLFGGGTNNHLLSDLLVQLLAVVLLVFGLNRMRWSDLDLATRQLLLIFALVLALPVLQLLPLPTGVMQWFPGRDQLWSERAALGVDLPMFAPWSIDPNATLAALRSLLPAAAMAVLGSQLSTIWLRRLTFIVIAMGLVMVFIGVAQVAQGPHSDLRPFLPTNPHDAVGLFANRNHYAVLLVAALAFVFAGLILDVQRSRTRRTAIMAVAAWTLLGCLLLLGVVLSRSRAGVGLAMLVALIMLAMAFRRRREHPRTFRWLLAVVVVSGLFAFQFGFVTIVDRLGQTTDLRWLVLGDVLGLASNFGWLGSGIGSFPAAYAAYEPIDVLGSKILNHAHNDWAEIWVEVGILALPVIYLFGRWFWTRVAEFRAVHTQGSSMQSAFLGGCVVVVVLCLHSLVDYPLRTTSVSVVFALACLLCTRSAASAEAHSRVAQYPDATDLPRP